MSINKDLQFYFKTLQSSTSAFTNNFFDLPLRCSAVPLPRCFHFTNTSLTVDFDFCIISEISRFDFQHPTMVPRSKSLSSIELLIVSRKHKYDLKKSSINTFIVFSIKQLKFKYVTDTSASRWYYWDCLRRHLCQQI